MDLLLIRHGHPDWAPGKVARTDPDLSDVGVEQANRVAHRLGSLDRVDELWASSMIRAQQTAAPVADEMAIGIGTFDWLQELGSPPEWEGAPGEEVERIMIDSQYRTMDEMWEGWPGGGESFRGFHERVVTGLEETLDSHGVHPIEVDSRHLWRLDDPEKRIIIVAHAGTNAVVLGHLLGLDPVPWEWERFQQPHTGVSRLTMVRVSTGWAFSLRQLGDVAHLHPALVTV